MTEYSGSCHCDAIGFRYATNRDPSEWSVRACQCRFCRMHDALSTSDPSGELQFLATEPGSLQRYRFALRTTDFLLCRNCGVYVGAVIEIGDRHYGIVNTHALNDTPANMADVGAVSYDDEDVAGRVGRRAERWTPASRLPWSA